MELSKAKDLTFKEINDIVQVKLLSEFMDGKMNVDQYSAFHKGLSSLFTNLHTDHQEGEPA